MKHPITESMIRMLLAAPAVLVLAAGCGGARPASDMPSVEVMEDGAYAEFSAVRPLSPGYVLSSRDVFDVDFLFEKQLSTRVKVRPDGKVQLPIVGEVMAAGRTPAELDSILTAAYATYFKDPDVNVNLLEFAPDQVFVLGRVRNARAVDIQPGMSVIQAIAASGGPITGADMGSVILLRRVGEDRAVARRLDVNAVLAGRAASWDLLLSPSDIVYVPATFVAQISDFVENFFGGLVSAPNLYLRSWEAFHTDRAYERLVPFQGEEGP